MSTNREKDMELLSAYLDDELNEESKLRLSSFLADSPDGRKALEQLRHTKSLLLKAPKVSAPADFLDMLEDQAEQVMVKHNERRAFWNWANPWAWGSTVAMSAAAGFALVIGLYTPKQIPYETLLNAHASVQGTGGIHQNLLSASHASGAVSTPNA